MTFSRGSMKNLTENEKRAAAIFYRVKAALIDPDIKPHKLWELSLQMEPLHSYGLDEGFMSKYIELDEMKAFVSKVLSMFENELRNKEAE